MLFFRHGGRRNVRFSGLFLGGQICKSVNFIFFSFFLGQFDRSTVFVCKPAGRARILELVVPLKGAANRSGRLVERAYFVCNNYKI